MVYETRPEYIAPNPNAHPSMRITSEQFRNIVRAGIEQCLDEAEKRKPIAEKFDPCNALLRMVRGEDVTFNCKSEKTSITYFNRFKGVVEELRDLEWSYWGMQVSDLEGEQRDQAIAERVLPKARKIPVDFLKANIVEIMEFIRRRKLCSMKTTMADAKRFGKEPSCTCYFYSGKAKTEPTSGVLTLTCQEETHTSKRRTKEELNAMADKVKEYIGTYDLEKHTNKTLPWGVGYYYSTTEQDFSENIAHMEEFLKKDIPPCTPRQAEYVAKRLGIDIRKAAVLNKYQAGELLTALFEDEDDSDEQTRKVIGFYKKKLDLQ